jgi:hypothetical protein
MKPAALLIRLASCALASSALAAPPIQSGADLASACEAFGKLDEKAVANAVHPHHCHRFLVSFFSALAEGEQAERDARVMGNPEIGDRRACVHLPEFLSYRDMAARVVAHARREPDTLQGPAVVLAQRTLEHDFPCAPARHEAP